MPDSKDRSNTVGALDLVEQATSLIRQAPLSVLAISCIGTMPFVLGLLFFFAHMAGSPRGAADLGSASLGLAVLYVWMKCWQSVYADRLMDIVLDRPPAAWSVSRLLRLISLQCSLQPWSLLVMPLAALFTLPYGWCRAFFQNVSILGAGRRTTGSIAGLALDQARLWPRQNHLALGILLMFFFFVGCNLAFCLALLPHLLQTFMGIETRFTQSGPLVWNTTFWTTVLGLSYVCVDPLVKGVYVLRCFYGRSLTTGEDLLLEVRKARHRAGGSLATIILPLLMMLTATCSPAHGAQEVVYTQGKAKDGLSAELLDQALDEELRSPVYGWRLPGEEHQEEDGPVVLALKAIAKGYEDFTRWVLDFWDRLFPPQQPHETTLHPGEDVSPIKDLLLFAGIGLAASLAAVAAWRLIRHRRRGEELPDLDDPAILPDLNKEDVRADELPEDAWRAMAEEFFIAGQNRLGVRAMYLAGLAFLAGQGLVTIAGSKSNLEYELELGRRSHALPGVLSPFVRTRLMFDAVWYGLHPASGDMVKECIDNHRILTSRAS